MTFGKRHPSGLPCGTERRLARRERMLAAAELLLPTGAIKCKLLDLSETGARLSVGRTFGLPDRLLIRIGQHTFEARVVRSRAGEIGVRFS